MRPAMLDAFCRSIVINRGRKKKLLISYYAFGIRRIRGYWNFALVAGVEIVDGFSAKKVVQKLLKI